MLRRAWPLLIPLLLASAPALTGASAAAQALLAQLSPAQQRRVSFAWDDEERKDLHLAPFFLDGAQLRDLNPTVEQQLNQLMGEVLSAQGLEQVGQIRQLELEVKALEREKGGIWRIIRHFRDPGRYYLAIFGAPSDQSPWGFRLDGHHVSVNASFVPGQGASVTPLFIGAQPRVASSGLWLLRPEEDLARALMAQLSPEQRERAVLPFLPGREMFLGKGPRIEPQAPQGVARGDLPPEAQASLDQLLYLYLARAHPSVAEAARARYTASGLDRVHFAWAGSEREGEPCYYRLQGPDFLIEFDNSLPEADHVHTIWREYEGDFGEDLLAGHYAAVQH